MANRERPPQNIEFGVSMARPLILPTGKGSLISSLRHVTKGQDINLRSFEGPVDQDPMRVNARLFTRQEVAERFRFMNIPEDRRPLSFIVPSLLESNPELTQDTPELTFTGVHISETSYFVKYAALIPDEDTQRYLAEERAKILHSIESLTRQSHDMWEVPNFELIIATKVDRAANAISGLMHKKLPITAPLGAAEFSIVSCQPLILEA